MSSQLTPRTTLAIAFLSFAGEVAWGVENQFFNVFVYNKIAPNTLYISLMVAFSALTATITAVTLGALSDKVGRRKVFFLIGFPLWAVTTAIFPLAGYLRPIALAVSMAVTFDCIMTFFGSMASDAALKAYSTDVTNLSNRGRINAVLEITMLIATLVTYGASGYIIDSLGFYSFFYLIGGIVGLFGTIGAIIAPEAKVTKSEQTYWQTLKSTLSIKELKKNKDCFLVFLATMFWGIGFNVFFPYIIIYLEHSVGLTTTQSSILIFVAILAAILGTIPLGFLVDKVGRKKIAIVSVFLEAVFLTLFALFSNLYLLALFGAFMMLGMMVWDVSTKTWTKDLYPEEKRGQFSGYYIIFTVLAAMGIGPFIGDAITKNLGTPIIIDGQPGFIPPNWIFIIGGLLSLLALIPLYFAKEAKKQEKEELVQE
ncbi:MAG: MFS transporter [Candidatus Heimdallarchaeaceae archaeon]